MQDIAEFSTRQVMLGRELTKQFEEILTGPPAALLIRALGESPRGEFTVQSSRRGIQTAAVDFDQRRVVAALLEELPPSQAARIAANICNAGKSAMYDLALEPAASRRE